MNYNDIPTVYDIGIGKNEMQTLNTHFLMDVCSLLFFPLDHQKNSEINEKLKKKIMTWHAYQNDCNPRRNGGEEVYAPPKKYRKQKMGKTKSKKW